MGDKTIKQIIDPPVVSDDDLYLQEKDVIDAFLGLPLQKRAVACEVIEALTAVVEREDSGNDEKTS